MERDGFQAVLFEGLGLIVDVAVLAKTNPIRLSAYLAPTADVAAAVGWPPCPGTGCDRILTMPNIRLATRQVGAFVDRWDPKLSLVIVLLLGVAYLSNIGPEPKQITRETAEWIHDTCLLAGALVALLQVAAGILKWKEPPPPGPPTGIGPVRDTKEEGLVFTSNALVGFPKARCFVPELENLELFVEWSEANPAIADANKLPSYQRKLLYESWYGVAPRSFLVMQTKKTFGDVWTPCALSIILALPEKTVLRLKNKEMSVIDLRADHLQFSADERRDRYLLYDTFIIQTPLRDKYSDFKRWHSLIHFAQFEPPARGRETSVFIEPDNPWLRRSFNNPKKYGSHAKFKLIQGHRVHEFVFPFSGTSTAKLQAFEQHWKLLHDKAWSVPVGAR